MIGIGMLSHTGNNVAMDSYGPISDNANGIGEMAWHGMEDEEHQKGPPDHGRSGCGWKHDQSHHQGRGDCFSGDRRGVACLLPSLPISAGFRQQLGMPKSWMRSAFRIRGCLLAYLLGGALPWLFSSLSIRAVTRAAGQIVEEVRNQFRIPGIMEGTVKTRLCACGWNFHCLSSERTDSAGDNRGADCLWWSVWLWGWKRWVVSWLVSSSAVSCWQCSCPMPAAPGTMPRNRLKMSHGPGCEYRQRL